MTISLVQSASSSTLVTNTITVTLGSPTTAGNCLIVAEGASGTVTNPTVTGITLGGVADNFGTNPLIRIGDPALSDAFTEIWADTNCAGGKTSVVLTYSGSPTTGSVWVYEFSGLASASILDQSSSAYSGSTQATWDSGTTATTTQPNELWVGANTGYSTTITGPGAPWINSAILNSGTRYLIAGYQIVSSTGTADYSGTYNGNSYECAAVVTLKGASVSGPEYRPVSPGMTWKKRFKPVRTPLPYYNPIQSTGPFYAATYDIINPGAGGWVNPANAVGSPDGNYATWTVP
jgi:hypothetical protein